MLSGRRLDLLDPSPLDIELEDIAHGLARVARWNGQTSGQHAFSVAQHSLFVEALFQVIMPNPTPKALLATMLHDAPEYVIGDMISPFKQVMGGKYKEVEDRLQAAIHLRFGLNAKLPAALKNAIKRADQIAAYHEATQLAGFSHDDAQTFFGKAAELKDQLSLLEPMPTSEAQAAFFNRVVVLLKQVDARS
ncbi:MAG: HD family hydrolase [Pseudomonadota bacterium]